MGYKYLIVNNVYVTPWGNSVYVQSLELNNYMDLYPVITLTLLFLRANQLGHAGSAGHRIRI